LLEQPLGFSEQREEEMGRQDVIRTEFARDPRRFLDHAAAVVRQLFGEQTARCLVK